jgi:uncharacterized protein (TIGR02996 family)
MAKQPPEQFVKGPEVLAFLKAIKEQEFDGSHGSDWSDARPLNDAPRLVFADWLEEHGNGGLAELIRVTCEAAQACQTWCLTGNKDRREGTLNRRARRLSKVCETGWLQLLTPEQQQWLQPMRRRKRIICHFYRGLIHISFDAVDLRQLESLAGSEAWAWVEDIDLYHVNGETIAAVAASPLLNGPCSLDTTEVDLDSAAASTLAHSRRLTKLSNLRLSGHFSGAALERIVASPHLTRLTKLELIGGPVSDEVAAALVRLPLPRHVTVLGLGASGIDDQSMKTLASWPALGQLSELHIGGNKFADRGIKALAASPHVANLKLLGMQNNAAEIGDSATEALVNSPYLQKLEHLLIEGTDFTKRGMAMLKDRFGERVRYDKKSRLVRR